MYNYKHPIFTEFGVHFHIGKNYNKNEFESAYVVNYETERGWILLGTFDNKKQAREYIRANKYRFY